MDLLAPHSLDELNRLIAESPGETRPVLGEGPAGAAIAFVGEQPSDQEDLQGRPFIGPAGQLLRQAMREAGLDEDKAYITNAVKRFHFEWRGKRRIHAKPSAGEIAHDRWWLNLELDFVNPQLVVALGATAALALAGKPVAVTKARGEMRLGQRRGYVTVHPSMLLRIPDPDGRREAEAAFLADLRRIRQLVN